MYKAEGASSNQARDNEILCCYHDNFRLFLMRCRGGRPDNHYFQDN